MKKVFFLLMVITMIASCSQPSGEATVPTTDSVAIDSPVVSVDTVVVDSL